MLIIINLIFFILFMIILKLYVQEIMKDYKIINLIYALFWIELQFNITPFYISNADFKLFSYII